jgi:hypothetical protein
MSTAAPALFALVESFFTEYLPRQRAAIRSFFKHLVRNDLAHSQQYTQVLAIPSKKARQRPATYSRPMTCEPSSPSLIVARLTGGATIPCCCSSTTAVPGSAKPPMFTGMICNCFPRVRYVYVARAKGTFIAAVARNSPRLAPPARHVSGERPSACLSESIWPAFDP